MVDSLSPRGPGPAARRRELEALLMLDALPGVGPRTVHRLLLQAGSASALLARPGALEEAVGPEAAAAADDPDLRQRMRRGLDLAERMEMRVLLLTDTEYPERLRHLADPPAVLFLRGDPGLLEAPGVGVVGSRRATARARSVAYRIGAGVASAGTAAVSGLALGVDGEAHRGALDAGGPTIAVLGRGADRAYPRVHHDLFRRVVERGLAVSEFLPGVPALPHHFPRRNRILAALSGHLVVVEAARRSGALISVDHALDLGVEVWSVPGPIDEPACEGSNALLSDGARPLTDVDAFLGAALGAAPRPASPGPVDGPEAVIFAALGNGGRSADELARETGVPAGRVVGALAMLELQGRVTRLPGMRFRKAG